jgi:hypothetical protein
MNNQTKTSSAAVCGRCDAFDSEYLRPADAARYVGHSESTLAKLRMRHMREQGPAFIKRGGVVLYRRSDLDNWLDNFTVR